MSHIFPVVFHSLAWENRVLSTEERRRLAEWCKWAMSLAKDTPSRKAKTLNEHLW